MKYIQKNEVHVIDIAKLSEDKQAYVFGDAVRTLYNLQLGEYNGDEGVAPPSRIVIFIDELNKYASKDAPRHSPILQQILDVAERGRSLGVVLFAAEQFRSAIHDRVTGNCSTHAYGRTNSIEVTKSDYKSVPAVYKTMMTRLRARLAKEKHSLKKRLEQTNIASGRFSGCRKHLSFTDLCLRTILQKNGKKNSGAYLPTS